MSALPKAGRPTTAWAVINHMGHIWVWTCAGRRKDSLVKLCEALPKSTDGKPAAWMRKNGCRCVRVTITEQAPA